MHSPEGTIQESQSGYVDRILNWEARNHGSDRMSTTASSAASGQSLNLSAPASSSASQESWTEIPKLLFQCSVTLTLGMQIVDRPEEQKLS